MATIDSDMLSKFTQDIFDALTAYRTNYEVETSEDVTYEERISATRARFFETEPRLDDGDLEIVREALEDARDRTRDAEKARLYTHILGGIKDAD